MVTERGKTCCFTGHRQIPFNRKAQVQGMLETELVRLVQERGITCFCAGGALGFDMMAAETVLRLRETRFPELRLLLFLPCPQQAERWPAADRARYQSLLNQADDCTYAAGQYTKECMFVRNRQLVDRSSCCICYLTKNSGGTAYTVRYAEEQGLDVYNLG